MAHYSLFCGDVLVCKVSHNTEHRQALSQDEINAIQEKARQTVEYKKFHDWIGFGYLEIKLNA